MENEREKAKDDLRAFADEYGLSAQELKKLATEVAQELERGRTVSSEVMQQDLSKLEVGWYAFEGKKFSPNPKAYPNCQGVVAWLNPDPNAPKGKRGLILTPEVFVELWEEVCIQTGIGDMADGQTNTQKLLAYGKEHGIKFPAAEWCASYSKNGVKAGQGFLPAVNQLEQIVVKIEVINLSLAQIGGVILDSLILSSTEFNEYGIYYIDTANGYTNLYVKDKPLCVRCVIAF